MASINELDVVELVADLELPLLCRGTHGVVHQIFNAIPRDLLVEFVDKSHEMIDVRVVAESMVTLIWSYNENR